VLIGSSSGPCSVFIDRDPEPFRYVLEYLRHGDQAMIHALTVAGRGGRALAREFRFYNLRWRDLLFDEWHRPASPGRSLSPMPTSICTAPKMLVA
jgi:hypothetical protein